jgi:excisionase family DNA binding protein
MPELSLTLSDAEWAELREDLVARVKAELEVSTAVDTGWLTTREAAAYLSMTPNALHKLTAARSIPFAQPGGPNGRCYFLRADLDEWRRS